MSVLLEATELTGSEVGEWFAPRGSLWDRTLPLAVYFSGTAGTVVVEGKCSLGDDPAVLTTVSPEDFSESGGVGLLIPAFPFLRVSVEDAEAASVKAVIGVPVRKIPDES